MTNATVRSARTSRAPGRWALAGMLCVAGLVGAPAAGASAATTAPAEHVGGSIVRMPSDSALRKLHPGGLVKVSVTPAKKPSKQGSVAVIQLARLGAGAPALISQETRRAGTFSAQIPPARSGRYRLKVYVGRAYTQVTFEVKFVPPVLPGPCAEPLDVSAELGVDSSEPSPGDTITVTLANSGPGCLQTGYGVTWQINRNGAWVDIPLNQVVPAVLLSIQPGKSLSENFTVPRNTAPGLYRIVKHFSAAGEAVDIDTEVTVVPS
jgi:hypothetical protein